MGRPETISCERCNADVPVKARGPVPSFCVNCRKTSKRTAATRPAHIECEKCGAQVAVRARGPLPRKCRGGCDPAPVEAPPATADQNGAALVVKRPWDLTSQPNSPTTRTAAAARAVPAPLIGDTAALSSETVTRIDQAHPVTVLRAPDLGRRFRAQQLRQAAAIGLWLAVMAIIALVVFIGSQPAAPNF